MEGINFNNKIQFRYNTSGQLNTIIDSLGHSYRFDYESNKLAIVREADSKPVVTYEKSDNAFTVSDAKGRKTQYKYAEPGINEIIYPSGKVSKYNYYIDYNLGWN